MRSRKAPRYQGTITSWKDDQGFGFIAPNGGGPAVFVHIKSLISRRMRPADGVIVTYELTVNAQGKPRAEQVAFVGDRAPVPVAPPSAATAFCIAFGFICLVAVFAFIGKLALWILYGYLALSVITFFAYALDKSAAKNNMWRTQESTLHLFGLAGGWPGALLAQRVFRHKSTKAAFRAPFRATIFINCCALCWWLMQ
jgi:uncharacterized membrane protein YsdA (DUF1294 family)/cold shock CspA family protein